jgi:3-oxoacyl-[acyl-carrier protein] reductase
MIASLNGLSVLVTGASKGIGKGIAKGFADAGAKVLIVARHESSGAAAVEEIRSAGGTANLCCADVSNRKEMSAAVARCVELYGGLDVLCANAGIFPSAELESMTDEQWDEVMNINVKSTFICVQICLPELKKSQAGRVVVTSSITGPITGFPGWAHYGASKSAQLGFIRTAAIELGKYQVTINAVMPGNILTEGLENMGQDYLAQMSVSIPLKRLGSTQDIANAAMFLASKEAGYVTGQTIVVDGGQVLPESLEAMD